MSKCDEGHAAKIEAGQILDPDRFPPPNELVCIQVPKVFDQVAIRGCETLTGIPLPGLANHINTNFSFEGAENFEISGITVISKSDSMSRPGFKKLKLAVRICFDIKYSFVTDQGTVHEKLNQGTVSTCATFNLVVNQIYCPDCITQIGLVRFPEDPDTVIDKDGTFIKAEALVEAFHDDILSKDTSATGTTLDLDVGAFFVIKCECEVQLLMPAYGYCPVPPEQQNPSIQTCSTFNDRCRTPFPTQFFPDQKWNPLDKGKKEDWDD